MSDIKYKKKKKSINNGPHAPLHFRKVRTQRIFYANESVFYAKKQIVGPTPDSINPAVMERVGFMKLTGLAINVPGSSFSAAYFISETILLLLILFVFRIKPYFRGPTVKYLYTYGCIRNKPSGGKIRVGGSATIFGSGAQGT